MPELVNIFHCEECSQELVDMNLRGGIISHRCANCGGISLDESQTPARKKAGSMGRLAILFAALSLVFSILTAIPAFYFAVKCLRIRQSPYVKPRGRLLAIAAIWTTIILTPVSSCCVSSIVLSLVTNGAVGRFEDPGDIQQMAKEIGTFELGDKWTPRKAQSIFGTRSVQYVIRQNEDEDSKTLAAIEVSEYDSFLPKSKAQFVQEARIRSIANTGHLNVKETERLDWRFCGESGNVILEKCTHSGNDVQRLIAVAKVGKRKYLIVAISRFNDDGELVFGREKFKLVIESFEPAAE